MATSYSSSSFLTVLATFFLYLTLSCSAYSKPSSSPTIASSQIKFWSENVVNQMPNPILRKLSPLTQKDTDFYTSSISNDGKFTADGSFCSLAKLACEYASNATLRATFVNYGYRTDAEFFNKAKVNANPFSFFRLSVLNTGNLVHLPNLQETIPDRAFLPSRIASKISISSMNDISKMFPQTVANAAQKESMEKTIFYCNAKAMEGETKSCPTSLEEMISFTKLATGGKKLISLSSMSTEFSNAGLIVKKVKKFTSDKIVACHELFLPFATYYCHTFPSVNLYSVDFVEPKTGAPVNNMVAICHMDTSSWSANHIAFEILKIRPGQGEACHWFTTIDLAWIKADEESL